MRKTAFITLALLFLCTACPKPGFLYRFTSADLGASRFWDNFGGLFPPGSATDSEDGLTPEGGGAQPREVVEPDVIRREGNLLYVLNQYRGLSLVDLDAHAILSQVPTYGYPRDLYLSAGRAYVLVGNAGHYTVENGVFACSVAAKLYVVDVATPSAAQIIGEFDLDGDLVDSRLVGDVLYAVCAEYEWTWGGVEVSRAKTTGSWVTSVNIADPAAIYRADQVSLAGYGDVIQATQDAIFVAAPDWEDWWNAHTTLSYVDISDPSGVMAVRGSVQIEGAVADRFKMDAYQGVLRVVSNGRRDSESGVYVTTVDLADPDNLTKLGEFFLEDAIGDALFATRFDGDRAYIVTYFTVDPLFVVDLSDPVHPSVTGSLEVPGWSTYIEPLGDRLIALGVDDTAGRRVKVSLFDVADPANPQQLDTVSFGEEWAWSSAYDDVKAFTVLDNLLIVPFSGWTEDFGGFQRLQFVSYDLDSLDARGYVDVGGSVLRSFDYGGLYYGVTTEQVAAIDAANLDSPTVTDTLVLAENVVDFIELSPDAGLEVLVSYDTGATQLKPIGLPLKAAEDVTMDIGEYLDSYLYDGTLVLIGVTRWEPVGDVCCDYVSYYTVAFVDCSTPTNPTVLETLRIDVEPFYGYFWGAYPPMYDGVVPVAEAGAEPGAAQPGGKDGAYSSWYPEVSAPESAFVVGNLLALRCWGTEFDMVLGEAAPQQGLALVNLDTRAWTSTLGLGYDDIISLNAAGDRLYLGTTLTVAVPTVNPTCAYFLRKLDPSEPAVGPAVNVPGEFVQYDPDAEVLTLLDHQWNGLGSYTSQLITVSWDGAGPASALDSVELPESSYPILGRGAKVYLSSYADGYHIASVNVSSGGALTMGGDRLVTRDGWASLIDAHGENAYVTIGSGALARYDFSGGGALAEWTLVMGTPLRMRFDGETAYAPCGYFGVVALPAP